MNNKMTPSIKPKAFKTQRTEKEQTKPQQLDAIPDVVHPSKSTKIINYVILLFLAIAAVGIAIILHWSFASENVIRVNNEPFPARIIPDGSDSSGVVVLTLDACKNTAAVGHVRTSFVSKTREVFLPISDEHLPKGCFKQDIPILIPKDIVPDTYQVKFHVTYDINPLKRGVVDEFVSKPFTISSQQ